MTAIPLEYPFDWTGLDAFEYPLDAQRLPLAFYGRKIGWQRNPITIAQFGLYRLQVYARNGQAQDRDAALRCGQWLAENLQPWNTDQFAWIYPFDLAFYGPTAPWISAMAQGEGISLLLRLQMLDADPLWLATAQKAFTPLQFTVEQGGVLDRLPTGGLIFEEYPTQPASHVLNGFVFALLGVYDLAQFFQDPSAHALCQEAVKTLLVDWRRWDAGFWTVYDLHPTHRLASPMYHELHIRQMRLLAILFEEPRFVQIAWRWRSMQRSKVCRLRRGGGKIVEKIRLLGRSR